MYQGRMEKRISPRSVAQRRADGASATLVPTRAGAAVPAQLEDNRRQGHLGHAGMRVSNDWQGTLQLKDHRMVPTARLTPSGPGLGVSQCKADAQAVSNIGNTAIWNGVQGVVQLNNGFRKISKYGKSNDGVFLKTMEIIDSASIANYVHMSRNASIDDADAIVSINKDSTQKIKLDDSGALAIDKSGSLKKAKRLDKGDYKSDDSGDLSVVKNIDADGNEVEYETSDALKFSEVTRMYNSSLNGHITLEGKYAEIMQQFVDGVRNYNPPSLMTLITLKNRPSKGDGFDNLNFGAVGGKHTKVSDDSLESLIVHKAKEARDLISGAKSQKDADADADADADETDTQDVNELSRKTITTINKMEASNTVIAKNFTALWSDNYSINNNSGIKKTPLVHNKGKAWDPLK